MSRRKNQTRKAGATPAKKALRQPKAGTRKKATPAANSIPPPHKASASPFKRPRYSLGIISLT